MLWKKRLLAGMATAGLVGTLGIGGATTASADGPDSQPPQELAQEIMALPWPTYTEGDEDADVYAAKQLLHDRGYFDSAIDDTFDSNLTRGVTNYQEDHGVEVNGNLDSDTWQTLSDLYFPPDDTNHVGPGDSGPVVSAIQRLLNDNGESVEIDGQYGGATETAVREFQSTTCSGDTCLDDDGLVGKYTWRALVTGGI
ncbi:peptidoglycan-binding protein [Spiractinospora alimapuensis]|uniref:peptidoglycan-binding domain-containing protein n=1 Tax=Spiractinospora alimapuensis TaxID=2820884 RepID=UPI001F37CB0C|nr:peptidoglycan-binding protein [Spiractinospora alimapuensis]QVQ53101.1 peptidoglycan-binding protein [Spiractinospora alimapuensis]